MESFELLFDKDVEKDLRKIPRHIADVILKKALGLQRNPHPPLSLKLAGAEGTYRLRVGDYRILYQVDHRAKTITIYHVRHRKDVYR